MSAGLLALLAAGLAYANGANDVSKGIATLVGAGLTTYRRAVMWGAIWTAAGGVVAVIAAGAMLRTFGDGLLASGVVPVPPAAAGTLGGAGLWVLIATRAGLPVSTTHALVGAIVGSSLAAYGSDAVAWSAIGTGVALPLLAAPVTALMASRLTLHGLDRVLGENVAADCLCVTQVPEAVVVIPPSGAMALMSTRGARWSAMVAPAQECSDLRSSGLGITVDRLHWISSGAVSFARGMNDAPKIVALGLAAAALGTGSGIGTAGFYALVISGMVVGSLLAGWRVSRVLAEHVTPMTHREGLAANMVTAALVTSGAVYGLPMSTTHVSTGGIIGIGSARGTVRWRTVTEIVLAWVITLPAAAVLAAAASWLAARLL
ncbi:MAG: inorganic phosphate transporter [Vicinamibacterales bacterium]